MGREIRMVPPNWKHPRGQDHEYTPLFDSTVEEAWADWQKEYAAWIAGGFEEARKMYRYNPAEPYRSFCDYHGEPPDPKHYRPAWTEPATWFQVYETVSEGTPITPPLPTKEALIEYLVTSGDYWGGKWDRAAAERFVDRGHAFSAVIEGGVLKGPSEQ